MIPMNTARELTVQSSRYLSEIENFWKLASIDGDNNLLCGGSALSGNNISGDLHNDELPVQHQRSQLHRENASLEHRQSFSKNLHLQCDKLSLHQSRYLCMSIEFFILLSAIQAENIVTPTKRLLDDLLTKSYITDIRPTGADENVTVVKIIPNMFILLEMSWKDPIYTWNPADYPDYNQDWIKLPENKLWSPGVVFQPSIAKEEFIPIEKRFVDLKYDGTVRQSNPSVITTPCTLKIDAFPYDVQICDLLIGPWSYDTSTVIVEPFDELYVPETDVFEGNSEWELIDIRAKAYTTFDPISKKNYSGIDYQVTLKRKPIYYVLVIQAPTFIISTLTIFGIFTPFSNTEERREKATS
ncbi:hypothetical protein WR25_02095 [Diploscapter pachys]|uniref:Neurotransmitter-gated ion-channel ligand-binding domain-containing protein n=1 Tax=Diploscapter pachys TaxID=2018661 RepID=A0A2A2K6U3_9BILA|nr:hypothetical protein WR25_02095 [Diploscapter pachys]